MGLRTAEIEATPEERRIIETADRWVLKSHNEKIGQYPRFQNAATVAESHAEHSTRGFRVYAVGPEGGTLAATLIPGKGWKFSEALPAQLKEPHDA